MNIFKWSLLLSFLIGMPMFSASQDFLYSANVQNAAFELLANSGGTDTAVSNGIQSITNDIVWDDETFQIPIGFSFVFAGRSFDSVNVRMNGTLSFDNDDKYNFIALFKDFSCEVDHNNKSLSPVSSKLFVLTDGSKRLKIEFQNAAFIAASGQKAHISFQIWLNQQNNSVEVHIGALDASVSNEACIIGLLNMNAGQDPVIGHTLHGNPGSPSGVAIQHSGNASKITNIPVAGTVYIFNPNVN